MKTAALVGIGLLFGCWSQVSLAQREVPKGIKSVGNIDIRLVAGFQAKCKVRTAGNAGEAINSIELKPNGQLIYIRLATMSGQSIAMEFGVNPAGRGFDDGPVKIGDTFMPLGEAMRQENGTNFYTQTLTQGTEIKTDMCKVFGGTESKIDRSFSVMGTTNIGDRNVLVVGGNRRESCRVSGKPIVMATYGWEAFDIESGLLVERSIISATGDSNGNAEQSAVDDWTCSLSKIRASTRPNIGGVPSVELRLTELKRLLDSGLITQQTFEKKSQDILKDF